MIKRAQYSVRIYDGIVSDLCTNVDKIRILALTNVSKYPENTIHTISSENKRKTKGKKSKIYAPHSLLNTLEWF